MERDSENLIKINNEHMLLTVYHALNNYHNGLSINDFHQA